MEIRLGPVRMPPCLRGVDAARGGPPKTGLLGQPLSETPEFWRAAPDAAVQWGAEEFWFPPEVAERVDDMHSGAAPLMAVGIAETEKSPLPEGLLRASGMRL